MRPGLGSYTSMGVSMKELKSYPLSGYRTRCNHTRKEPKTTARAWFSEDMGYGYGWWTATVDDHDFNFAWGHGGQLIVLLEDLDMVVVTTADPFFGEHSGNSWAHESAILNMVGRFINTLPGG